MDHTASSSPLQQRATTGSQQQPGSGHIQDSVETNRGQPSSSFSLPNTKTIELIGEEFVQRMKTEPEEVSSEAAVTRPSVVMSVTLANNREEQPPVNEPPAEQQNLVYCNLNDLDFGAASDNSSFALVSTTQLGETPSTSITTNANQQLLQMVQAVPGLQITSSDKNPYSAVSTILLQGGILQVLAYKTVALNCLPPLHCLWDRRTKYFPNQTNPYRLLYVVVMCVGSLSLGRTSCRRFNPHSSHTLLF